jgi:perosamine synthetase
MMSEIIPLSIPSIQGNEWKYIKECLDGAWVSSAGSYVKLFEKKIAEYTGAKYAIACVNGTSALHLSLILAGVLPNDEVLVPTITFIATINAVNYCKAYPVFMDADKYYNLDTKKTIAFIKNETKLINDKSSIESIGQKNQKLRITNKVTQITVNKKTGRRISGIVPVHIFGNAVWLDELYEVCGERNIKIIEDASESLGTRYIKGNFRTKHTGTIGVLGCLSFNGNKIVTSGGGGMILTDNKEYAKRAKFLTTQAKDDKIRSFHSEIGYNYRLTNIQAALGVAQLEQISSYLNKKKENYRLFKKNIDQIKGLHLSEVPEYAENNYWMYALQIDKNIYKKDREELMDYLSRYKIKTRPLWYLNHLQKPYKDCQNYKIEKALELLEKTLNIPCSVNLKMQDIERVLAVL